MFVKHTIVIYEQIKNNQSANTDLEYLGREATSGEMICDGHEKETVSNGELPEGVASFFFLEKDNTDDTENNSNDDTNDAANDPLEAKISTAPTALPAGESLTKTPQKKFYRVTINASENGSGYSAGGSDVEVIVEATNQKIAKEQGLEEATHHNFSGGMQPNTFTVTKSESLNATDPAVLDYLETVR